MKTALRTYHPVPSLQKTDGNAQDAPRIKNCLKAALLPAEVKGEPPSTPDQILEMSVSGPNSIRMISKRDRPFSASRAETAYKCRESHIRFGKPCCCAVIPTSHYCIYLFEFTAFGLCAF